MKISPARIAAFEILAKIEKEKAFSSVLLPVAEAKLPEIDKGLCHEITLGVLRNQIYLDALIGKFSNGKKIDPAIKIILRIALYQLAFLDKIPAHAAINDAVNLVQFAKKTSAKGFVNAILRRFTREKIEFEFADETERVAVETSHPKWLIEKWIENYGVDEAAKLAEINNQTPKLSFRWTARTSEAIKKSLDKANIEHEKQYLRELAEGGKIYFQDKASQMVAAAVNLKDNESFLDLCAAPGSKTTQIAAGKARNENLMAAGDRHWKRIENLKENCQKQGVEFISILQYDAENALPFADESFDVVLVDAPCTGTGTIRHNPEIRYFLDKKDFAELSAKQLKILRNASKLIKRGGRIIYSTCSLETEENEEVAENFLAESGEFEKVLPELNERFLTQRGFARTFPPRDESDGFFVAVFRRK